MINYKIEAFWDCSYCNQSGNRGSQQSCPQCGNPRDESVTFYLPQNIDFTNAVDESKQKVSMKPDWFCPYCNRYNPSDLMICKNCGSTREACDRDYFSFHVEQ